MTSLIINMPHLQNRRQRYGAMLLSGLCWAWFLMPLVIVGGWLMGFRVLAQEVVWLGGWQSLLRLTELAATLIASLVGAWTLWTLIDMRRSATRHAPIAPAIDAATALGADPQEVAAALRARVTTVHFTAGGIVSKVEADATAGTLRPRLRTTRRKAAVA